MPLSWLHSDEYELDAAGKKVKVPVKDALRFAQTRQNESPYSYELLQLMVGVQEDRGDSISTTTLLSECDRNLVLERMEPYSASPEELWPAFKGTMFHLQLEKVAAPGAVVEVRFAMTLPNGKQVTCKPDLIDPVAGLLDDYKVVKELPKFNYPYRHHADQLMVNRYIVDHAHSVMLPGTDTFVPVEEAEEALGRPLRPLPGVWAELRGYYIDPIKGPKPLTVTRSEEGQGKNGKTKKVRVPDFGDDDALLEYITTRYDEVQGHFEAYKKNGTVPAIPKEWDGWTGWLCNFCPVKKRCVSLFKEGR